MITDFVVFLRFLQTSAYICLFFFFLIRMKEPKRQRIAITVAIYAVVSVAYFSLLYTCGQAVAERLIIPVEVGLCLTLLMICSADKWSVSLFIMFTQFNLYLGISYISDICINESSELAYNIQYLTARTVLFGALLFFVYRSVRPHFRRLVEGLGNEWFFITFLAFSFYVLEAVILYCPRFYWHEADARWYLVASSYLVFFSAYGLIFRSIRILVEKYEIRERERVLAQQKKMWEEQIEEQNHAISAARRDRHDLRHHYDTLLAMLTGGKTQEAVSYLNTQSQNMEGAVLSGVCAHTAANAILSRWAARAMDHGISTELDVRIPAELPMDDVALVGIIANAFENAVEGCLRCPDGTERLITVKAAYSVFHGAGKLHLVVENPCVGNIVFEDGFPKSQKPGGGTGTKSIRYTAERYSGMVEFTTDHQFFRTRVLLHLHEQTVS